MNRPVIALDADGVLVDYNLAYARAWERAFGVYPVERDPHAYWAIDRWGVERLEGERLQQLRDCLDEAFWSSMEAMPRAADACHALHEAGYELVCVSALHGRYAEARADNLRELGFPIDRIVATGRAVDHRSPKADAVAALQPAAFVDDYLPYFTGVEGDVHKALVMRGNTGSPNQGEGLSMIHSQHADLADFAAWWLKASGKHRD